MRPEAAVCKMYDVIVVGGGFAGVCAAIASARNGARTALIQDRPVLGGNGSSEIRMHVNGADCHSSRPNARETGIIEEILLENRYRNPQNSFSILDTVLWEKASFQEGLDLYLNTRVTGLTAENNLIKEVEAVQMTTEKEFILKGYVYIDATGDGYLAAQAGALFKKGRESKAEFGEEHALEAESPHTMGSTIMFKAVDMGRPVEFMKPSWAYTYTDEDLKYRKHSAKAGPREYFQLCGVESGYWWIETGGTLDTVKDAEDIRDELVKILYGVWDHIKNGGDHGAENYALDWVGFLPGKRESRRILGDYVLKEQDIMNGTLFKDAVAYGGWPMDLHPVEGINYKGEPSDCIFPPRLYSIPYRCFYSQNIANLMLAGRNISATHMAFSSTRVMATCAVGGQAAGTAAALAAKYGCSPREVAAKIHELQQMLLKEDCYIPGIKNEDPGDKALNAMVEASSFIKGGEPENIINGVHRTEGESGNFWESEAISDGLEWISLNFEKVITVKQVLIRFDSNLSQEIVTTLSEALRRRQVPGVPPQLVKDYAVEFLCKGKLVLRLDINGNYQRFRRHSLDSEINCDQVRIVVAATNGISSARIFEVRVY